MRLPNGVTVREDERLRSLLTPLNLHIAVLGILVLLIAFIGVRIAVLHGKTGEAGNEAVVAAQGQLAAARTGAERVRGLDTKLATSSDEAAAFYTERLPYGDAEVATQLGDLAKKFNVRLSRAQYVHGARENDLTPVRIEASITGEYASVAEFINGLERNRKFFLIENLGLGGAQGGLVNLRLRIETYEREPAPAYAAAQTREGGQP